LQQNVAAVDVLLFCTFRLL